MNDERLIRWVLLGLGVVAGSGAFFFRLRSQTSESLDRRQEGWVILIGLRLSAIPAGIAIVLWMVDPAGMAWAAVRLPIGVRWCGLAMMACTGMLVLWTFYNLGGNLTDTVVTRREHTLVTSGPYEYVRHPFYVAFALGLLGVSLAMANWFILAVGLVPFGFIVRRTRIEEAKLVERFGDQYRDYMKRVGRFWPRRARNER